MFLFTLYIEIQLQLPLISIITKHDGTSYYLSKCFAILKCKYLFGLFPYFNDYNNINFLSLIESFIFYIKLH